MKLIDALDLAASAATIVPFKEEFPGVSEFMWNQPWPEMPWALDFPKAASMVPTVYACTTLIAQDVAAVPLRFYSGKGKKKTEVERKPGNIVDLWEKGNPEQSGYEVERDRELSLRFAGNAYLYLERFGLKGPPEELWTIPGHLMKPVPGPRRAARQYEYHAGGRIDRFPAESIIHFRLHNPSWTPLEPSMVGLSPLEAARLAYEARFNMGKWQQRVFEKGGALNMILSTLDKAGWSDAELVRWQKKMDERYSGTKNQGKPVVLNGMKLEKAGMTQKDMEFVDTAKMTDADICRVFFVPPIYVGIKEGGGLSDAGAATDALIYVENAIKPACKLRDAVLTEKLCPLFGEEDITCQSDLSGLLAVQRARLDQAKGLKELTGRPIYTVNEARVSLGDEESDDPTADDLVVPTTVQKTDALDAPDPVLEPVPGAAAPQPAAPRPERREAAKLSRALLGRRREMDRVKYERKVAAWARSYFSSQERAALSSLDSQRASQMVSLAYSVDDMMDPDESAAASAQRLFEQLILERGEAAAAEVGVEVALKVTSGRIAEIIQQQAARLVTQIDETTREELRHALARAIEEQASFADVTAAVRQVFDDRRANALTIARTETTWAYNLASMETWSAAGITHKTWLTIGDEAVRMSHVGAEADGPIPIGERFSNGLLYPGDPGGPAEEVINCRCVIEAELEAEPVGAGLARVFARNSRGGRLGHLFHRNGVAH